MAAAAMVAAAMVVAAAAMGAAEATMAEEATATAMEVVAFPLAEGGMPAMGIRTEEDTVTVGTEGEGLLGLGGPDVRD